MYSNFREEAKSTSLIGHENIVFVTDFGKCPTSSVLLRHGATAGNHPQSWVKMEKLAGLDDE